MKILDQLIQSKYINYCQPHHMSCLYTSTLYTLKYILQLEFVICLQDMKSIRM